MNNLSMDVFKALATSWANFRDGLYLPCSRKTMVSRLTWTRSANCSWVRFNLARYSLILVCIIIYKEQWGREKKDGRVQSIGHLYKSNRLPRKRDEE